jgi:hypothetical protein
MAANCVQDLEAAVKAVKDEYGNDPKWAGVIEAADKAVSEAHAAEGNPAPASPGQEAASQVHDQVKSGSAPSKLETPAEQAKETPQEENAESPAMQKAEGEDPKDMKSAAKIAIMMLRKK